MADRQFVLGGIEAAPADWDPPGALTFTPKTAFATFDGSNAAGAFLPCLEIISDSGHVVAICRPETTIAAGASAIVSWFPGGEVDDDTALTQGSGSTVDAIASPNSTLTVTNPVGPTVDLDMPTTGVTAATYGDATHVGEFTVDAEGRITSASSVPISGSGGAGGLIVLYDSGYLGADAASIDTGANGVASGHFALIIIGYLRSTNAVSNDNIGILFNNDSAAHYEQERLTASGASVSSSANTAQSEGLIGVMPGANATASFFGGLYATVPAYDGTSNFKTSHGHSDAIDSSGSNAVIADWSTVWNQTAAINRIRLRSQGGGGNIKAGSRVIIYGVQ